MAITKIAQVDVGAGGPSSIDFTGIPGTYTDLMLVFSGRSSSGSSADCYLRLNGSNYGTGHKKLEGNGSSVTSSSANPLFKIPASTYTANTFGSVVVYLPNYASSNPKSASVDAVSENNASSSEFNGIYAIGFTDLTTAVTSMGVGFSAVCAQYSSATLYGISKSGATGATVS